MHLIYNEPKTKKAIPSFWGYALKPFIAIA